MQDRRAGPGWRARLGSALVVAGALLLLGVAAFKVDSMMTRARVIERLEQPQPVESTPGAARAEARETGIVGRIEAPRIDLDVPVLEGLGTMPLMRGAGHDPASALPGESGNIVLAGHRDTHFRALRDVRVGDRIEITTVDGSFPYRVDTMLVVDPDRTDLLLDEGVERLTLVTCYPFYWAGPAPQRMVVQAYPIRRPSDEPLRPVSTRAAEASFGD